MFPGSNERRGGAWRTGDVRDWWRRRFVFLGEMGVGDGIEERNQGKCAHKRVGGRKRGGGGTKGGYMLISIKGLTIYSTD